MYSTVMYVFFIATVKIFLLILFTISYNIRRWYYHRIPIHRSQISLTIGKIFRDLNYTNRNRISQREIKEKEQYNRALQWNNNLSVEEDSLHLALLFWLLAVSAKFEKTAIAHLCILLYNSSYSIWQWKCHTAAYGAAQFLRTTEKLSSPQKLLLSVAISDDYFDWTLYRSQTSSPTHKDAKIQENAD